jgi:secondary thiamine-phosphate synthase enzyme
VRREVELFFERLAPENLPGISHTMEGPDDMPAHIKASLVGFSVSIPIVNARLDLGTWQGIYLCEFRNIGGARRLTATIIGD